MPGLSAIKATARLLVKQGRADELDEFVETVLDGLTVEEQAELRSWLMTNGPSQMHDDSLPEVGRNWKRIARHMREGDTLRDVLPRLPEDLQEFLREQAKAGHK